MLPASVMVSLCGWHAFTHPIDPRTGDADPLAEPPLPAVPEAAEGSLPRVPGPAIPTEIAERGSAAGQAAQEAQPDAAAQPVMTGVAGDGDVKLEASLPKVHRGPGGAEADEADPPSPAGIVDSLRQDSIGDSGKSSDGGDDSGDAEAQGSRSANLTISTGVKGGLKLHESSGDSAADSPALSRQNRCALMWRELA